MDKVSHRHSGLQLKKVLSANPEATINVECIMNDIDVSGKMTRDLFEEKSASVLQRARDPLQKVLLKQHQQDYNPDVHAVGMSSSPSVYPCNFVPATCVAIPAAVQALFWGSVCQSA